MSGSHFAWELFKLTLGIVLIMTAAIYSIVRFCASIMKIDAYTPTLCGAETMLTGADGDYMVSCDRQTNHDGYHHDDSLSVDWSDASFEAEVAP
jgi:hypothetical protein